MNKYIAGIWILCLGVFLLVTWQSFSLYLCERKQQSKSNSKNSGLQPFRAGVCGKTRGLQSLEWTAASLAFQASPRSTSGQICRVQMKLWIRPVHFSLSALWFITTRSSNFSERKVFFLQALMAFFPSCCLNNGACYALKWHSCCIPSHKCF